MGETFAAIQDAIGEKFSQLCFALATTISAVGYSLYIGPTFAIICLAYLPLVVIVTYIFGQSVRSAQLEKREVAKKMGGVIEEILSAIKLISSFAQEGREVEKFAAIA
jgi:ABC-type multidrug transport system fused ATPase/permease subunit